MVYRIYVEKKPGFDVEAQQLQSELASLLGITELSGLRIINRYDVEGISEELADLRIVVGADGSNLLNLVVVVANNLCVLLDVCHDSVHCLVDTTLEVHWVSTSGNVLKTFCYDSLCEDGSCRCTIAGIVTSL